MINALPNINHDLKYYINTYKDHLGIHNPIRGALENKNLIMILGQFLSN